MALHDTSTIDALGVEDSGTLVLSLMDEVDWQDPQAHWHHLTDKLNSYLNFLVSGEVLEHHPDAVSGRVRVDVIFKYPPPDEVTVALGYSQKLVGMQGYALAWVVLAS